MKNLTNLPQYRIFAQNHNNQLIIEVRGENYWLMRDAQDVLADQALLKGFSQTDIQIILSIVNDL